METMQNPVPPVEQPKNNKNIIIGVVVAVVLCCCCVVTGVGGYYAYQTYVAAQQAVEDLQNFEIPADVPFNPLDPNSTAVAPEFDFSGDMPSGGLADDETRLSAWLQVQIYAALSGCSAPTVEGTTITVTNQPDASGAWEEEWNVNCGDQTSQSFKVTYSDQNGVVTPLVEPNQ